MTYTNEQLELFNNYKEEIESVKTIKQILTTCLTGRIWTHSPEELPNELRDELDAKLSEKMLELKNAWHFIY